MNSEIEKIFSGFKVNDKIIPFSFLNYKGKNETFVVYNSLGETPEEWGDNEPLTSVNTYDFNIYTKGNYLEILKEIKKKLKANGWTWEEDSEDIYEEDTGYFHKVTTWSKEDMI